MTGITKTIKDLSKFKWLVENLALIQYMNWEKVQPIAIETYDSLSSEYPLMINWSEIDVGKRDQYDTDNGCGHGKIDNIIIEEYRTAKIAKEGIIPEKIHEPEKCKGGGKGLFCIRDVFISTDHITEDHIEVAKVYIQTLCYQLLLEPRAKP
ncbi:hypothetical protein D1007_43904 [Hordeum vulgare]|nr:hypothetical protein D1007_43904 [Hordeum vulgare]